MQPGPYCAATFVGSGVALRRESGAAATLDVVQRMSCVCCFSCAGTATVTRPSRRERPRLPQTILLHLQAGAVSHGVVGLLLWSFTAAVTLPPAASRPSRSCRDKCGVDLAHQGVVAINAALRCTLVVVVSLTSCVFMGPLNVLRIHSVPLVFMLFTCSTERPTRPSTSAP